MHLKGNHAKKLVSLAKGLAKIWLKAAQLFALTYDPVTIDELPEVYVRVRADIIVHARINM